MSKYNNLCPTQYVEEDQNVEEHPDYRETGAEELTALRSQLADVKAQVEVEKDRGDRWEKTAGAMIGQVLKAEAQVETLQNEVCKLRAALRKYGDHKMGCPKYVDAWKSPLGGCNCGFEAILK